MRSRILDILRAVTVSVVAVGLIVGYYFYSQAHPLPGEEASPDQEETPAPSFAAPAPTAAPIDLSDPDSLVWCSASGKKFHSSKDCPSLKNSVSFNILTIEQATEKELTPCSKCCR